MPRRKKPAYFPPWIRAIWQNSLYLKPCRPKYGRVGMDKFIEHIKKDKCEQCVALHRQLDYESTLIAFLKRSRN